MPIDMTPQPKNKGFFARPMHTRHQSSLKMKVKPFVPQGNKSKPQTLEQKFAASDEKGKMELIKTNLTKLLKSQIGSRHLQKMLKKANSKTIEFFINEIQKIKYGFTLLITDRYGNYFLSELLHSCSRQQRLSILDSLVQQGGIAKIACHKKGTHVIQKFIELSNSDEEEKFFETALKGRVAEYAIDKEATHVIQKAITCFSEQNRQFLFDEITEGIKMVYEDQYGLCVLKKLITGT